MRKFLIAALLVASMGAMPLLSAPAAHADPGGSGYIYWCDETSLYPKSVIAFNDIWQCPHGIVRQQSTYTGKYVAWISGLCANQRYMKYGWRDRTRIWNYCLTHER